MIYHRFGSTARFISSYAKVRAQNIPVLQVCDGIEGADATTLGEETGTKDGMKEAADLSLWIRQQ